MASTATLLCSHVAPRSCATRTLEKSAFAGTSVLAIPALEIPGRASTSVKVRASGIKKIKVADPWGPGGGANFRDGVDASGRKAKGKGVYQFTNKYGANVDGYSPIYSPEEWSPSGDVYVGAQESMESIGYWIKGNLGNSVADGRPDALSLSST